MMRAIATTLHVVLTVSYPVAVWWCLSHFGPRAVGLMLLAVIVPLMALRLRHIEPQARRAVLRVPLSVMALLLVGVALDDERFMLMMPVLISVVLLFQFASSLRGPESMVERFARMQRAELDAARRAHCRQVTGLWCAFFVVNGAIAAILALAAPLSWWAAYTGGIAYGLMGLLFAGEIAVRIYRFGPGDAPAPVGRLASRWRGAGGGGPR